MSLFSRFSHYLSLEYVYDFCTRKTRVLIPLTVVSILVGLYWSLVAAPTDYKQGEAYRILYIHAPAAWMSLLVYVIMAGAGACVLIWRTKIAELIHSECAPLGVAFTAMTLLTGMLWGKPMWGTYWVWDARLTSELILLFLYLGIIGLGSAISDPRKSAQATSILSIVGVINIPIIHYSVIWWNTLHQGPTVTRLDTPAAHWSILLPLLFMALVMKIYFVTALLLRIRNRIIERFPEKQWLSEKV